MPHCLSEIGMWLPDFGGMHLKVFMIIIFKTGRGDQLNGGIWFSGSDHWRVKDGWRILDRDLKSASFQSCIPVGWFCLMNDLYWGKEVKRSMSLLSFLGVYRWHEGPQVSFGAHLLQWTLQMKSLITMRFSAMLPVVCTCWSSLGQTQKVFEVISKVLKCGYRRQLSGIVISLKKNKQFWCICGHYRLMTDKRPIQTLKGGFSLENL